MSATDSQSRGGAPGWMKLLLVLSLAGNLAVAGMVLGNTVRDREDERRGPDRVINWIVGMVPEERRDDAAAAFGEARQRIEAARAMRSERLPAVVTAMRAEPFDPAALDAALDAMFDRDTSGRKIVRETMISLLGQFTPEERSVFAQHFEERLGNRGERRHD